MEGEENQIFVNGELIEGDVLPIAKRGKIYNNFLCRNRYIPQGIFSFLSVKKLTVFLVKLKFIKNCFSYSIKFKKLKHILIKKYLNIKDFNDFKYIK